MTVRQRIVVGVVVALTTALVAWAANFLPQPREDRTLVSETIEVKCPNSGGQKCSRTWQTDLSLPHEGRLEVSYRVPDTHCGPGDFWFYVDGQLVGKTGTLGWIGNPLNLPLHTTIVTDNVPEGNHKLVLQAFGVEGGCNEGTIVSHEGFVTVTLLP